MKNIPTKPLLIAAIVLFGVLGIGLILRSVSEVGARDTSLTVKVAPRDSSVTLNGKSYKNGTYKIKAGEYNLSITREGFTSINTKVTLEGDNASVAYILESNSPSTANWYENNQEDTAIAEGIHGDEYEATISAQKESAPIIDQLPFIGPGFEYRIDYGPDDKDNKKVIIYVSANSEDAKKNALQWIKDQGTDPGKLNIVYEAYENAPVSQDSPISQNEINARQ
jgi:hypothetical protein